MTCPESRGEPFDFSLSKSWSEVGNYSLGLELNLGYNYDGTFGLDTVALGLSNATGGPTLQRQVVAGLETYDYYTGLFGLGNQPTNFTASNDLNNLTDTTPYPSFLATLKNQTLIPSLSWAYTAGAIYRESISIIRPRNTSIYMLQYLRTFFRILKCCVQTQADSISCSRLTLHRIERRLRKLDVWRLRCFKASPKQRHFRPCSRYLSGFGCWTAINKFDHRKQVHNKFATNLDLDFYRLNLPLHLPPTRIMSSI